MYYLASTEPFPPIETAHEDGLLAVGGDLSVARLKEAYSKGIFPWFSASQPVLWYSPDPRMVLFPNELKVSRSMKRLLRKNKFKITFNKDFKSVIENCATISRKGQDDTWITPKMQQAYLKLHEAGWAHSAEVLHEGTLVGGIYGVYLKNQNVFCGESMFFKESNASKFALIKLVEKLRKEGIKLFDCQVYSAHLESLGAREIPRSEFLKYLR